jgi:hypothetical protein
MDDNIRWHLMNSGELVHVDADLDITRHIVFREPPKCQLTHADLTTNAAASQHASVA